jgi:hypothetical protein
MGQNIEDRRTPQPVMPDPLWAWQPPQPAPTLMPEQPVNRQFANTMDALMGEPTAPLSVMHQQPPNPLAAEAGINSIAPAGPRMPFTASPEQKAMSRLDYQRWDDPEVVHQQYRQQLRKKREPYT